MRHKNRLSWKQPLVVIRNLLLLVFLLLNVTAIASALTAEQIAEKALASTVYLEMEDRNGKSIGFGSGFFIRSHWIATNYHVIKGATQGTAKLVDSFAVSIGSIIAIDEKNDLAILEVPLTLDSAQPLSLGNSETVRTGQTIYVTGNPWGLEGTISDGIVSSIRRYDNGKKRIQMTAPISPGSSGGPVLNKDCEVIGVSYMTIEGGQNLNFAIPSNYFKALLKQAESSGPTDPSKSEPNPSELAETYYYRGNMMFSLGLYNEAILEYNKAIGSNLNYTEAYNSRGIARMKLEHHVAAIADFEAAIDLNPDYVPAYVNRGFAKFTLLELGPAIKDIDTALRLNPDYAPAYLNLGLMKGTLGDPAAAIVDINKALHLNPDLLSGYRYRVFMRIDLAKKYALQGIHMQSLSQFRLAVEDCQTVLKLIEENVPDGISKEKLEAEIEELLKIIDMDVQKLQ